jgi:hypothetical protein
MSTIYNVYFLFNKNNDFEKNQVSYGIKTNWDLYFNSNNRQLMHHHLQTLTCPCFHNFKVV